MLPRATKLCGHRGRFGRIHARRSVRRAQKIEFVLLCRRLRKRQAPHRSAPPREPSRALTPLPARLARRLACAQRVWPGRHHTEPCFRPPPFLHLSKHSSRLVSSTFRHSIPAAQHAQHPPFDVVTHDIRTDKPSHQHCQIDGSFAASEHQHGRHRLQVGRYCTRHWSRDCWRDQRIARYLEAIDRGVYVAALG